MKKTMIVCLIVSTMMLAACQQTKKSASESSKVSESTTTAIKETSTTSKASAESTSTSSSTTSMTSEASSTQSTTESSTSSSTQATESTTVANLLWSTDKANQLASFMSRWGQTMGQSYQAYSPGNNVSLYGLPLPDAVLNHTNGWQATVANAPISLSWTENGEVPSGGYGLVAVYSDAQTQSGQKPIHVYFFTIEEGTPKVLVTSQNQGNANNYLELRETENQELKNGFSQIVAG